MPKWTHLNFVLNDAKVKVATLLAKSDVRELNKRVVRKPYPLPKISTVLQELGGFQYATALDPNMGYYTLRLDLATQELCTIISPWGKYSYLHQWEYQMPQIYFKPKWDHYSGT